MKGGKPEGGKSQNGNCAGEQRNIVPRKFIFYEMVSQSEGQFFVLR